MRSRRHDHRAPHSATANMPITPARRAIVHGPRVLANDGGAPELLPEGAPVGDALSELLLGATYRLLSGKTAASEIG